MLIKKQDKEGRARIVELKLGKIFKKLEKVI